MLKIVLRLILPKNDRIVTPKDNDKPSKITELGT